MSGVAGTERDTAGRQGYGQANAALPNGKGPATQSDQGASAKTAAPATQAQSSDIAAPSCGIAGIDSGVTYLPDVPSVFSGASAPTSSQAADGLCQINSGRPDAAADAAQTLPAPASLSSVTTPAWKQKLDERLSRSVTVDDFVAVLKQQSAPDHQGYVVHLALLRFMELGSIDDFTEQCKDTPGLRTIVAEQLFLAAIHPGGVQQRRSEFAARYAANVVAALPQKELGTFLSARSKDDGVLFAQALLGNHSRRNMVSLPGTAGMDHRSARNIDRVLIALNETPATPTTGAIVESLCLQMLPTDFVPRLAYEKPPLSSRNVAKAVANLWYPADSARAKDATERLEGLLADRRGIRLLTGGSSSWGMELVFAVVRDNPGITRQALAGHDGDPMRHPAVKAALAQKLVSMVSSASAQTPGHAPVTADAVQRLSDILQTDAGQNLVSGPAPVKAKLEAVAAIVVDPRITAKTFTSDDPFANPLVMERIAPLYAAAGAPQELPGNSARNLVGFALGLMPTLPNYAQITPEDLAALQGAFAEGRELKDLPPKVAALLIGHDLFPKNEAVDKIVATFTNRANTKPPRVAFEFNVVFTKVGPVRCPAFRLQVADFDPATGGPKYEIVDNVGRYYAGSDQETSNTDYVHHANLPAGVMYYTPHNPFGKRDRNGVEELVPAETRAANSRVRDAINTAALVGCFAAGIVGLAVTGGTLALAAGGVGAAGSAWDIYQGYQHLADRAAHGQSNNPFAAGGEGRDALMLELGMGASVANLGAFAGGTVHLGLSAAGAIGKDTTLTMPVLRVLNTGAAGTNIAALTVAAADLARNAKNMSPAERQQAALALVFHFVLAAKPLVGPHSGARPALLESPPGPKPAAPPPSPAASPPGLQPFPLPPAVARLRPARLPPAAANARPSNYNLGVVNGGQTTPGNTGNAAPQVAQAAASNGNAAPQVAQAAAQQPVAQPVALAANGGNYVPTGLDPAQTSAVGHPRPPGSRPTVRPGPTGTTTPASGPAAPTLTSAAPSAPSGTRRLGSNPRAGSEPDRPPSEPPSGAEPGTISPVTAGSRPDPRLRDSLFQHHADLWSHLPVELRQGGSDGQIALWLSDHMPAEWEAFRRWLYNSNYKAYTDLPATLKLPQDQPPVVAAPSTRKDSALEGYLFAWLKAKGYWDSLPEVVRQGSEHEIALWVERNGPDAWKDFNKWLIKKHNDVYRRKRPDLMVEEENTVAARPPVAQNDVRGGRRSSIGTDEFVGAFGRSLAGALPENANPTLFIDMLRRSLPQTRSPSGNMITVGEFFHLAHACAEVTFNQEIVRQLDGAMHSLVPDATMTATPGIVSGEIGSRPSRYREGDLLPLDRLNQALAGLRH